MSFFYHIFIGMFILCIFSLAIAISLRLLYCIFLIIHAIFKQCCCKNTPRNSTAIDDFFYLIEQNTNIYNSCNYTIYTIYNICISRIISSCNCKKKYKRNNKKIIPIIYDDVHIIVINPCDKFQIGTIATIVNK